MSNNSPCRGGYVGRRWAVAKTKLLFGFVQPSLITTFMYHLLKGLHEHLTRYTLSNFITGNLIEL